MADEIRTTRSTLTETAPLFDAIREKEEAIKELQGEIEQLYARIADIEEGKGSAPKEGWPISVVHWRPLQP